MPRSRAPKTFSQFVIELNDRSVAVDGSQLFSQAENAAGRELLRPPRRKRDAQDDEQNAMRSSAKVQSRVDGIRRELAALYIDIDLKLSKLTGRNDAPAQDADLKESFHRNALAVAKVLAESDPLLSQTKSAVIRILSHVQGLNREVFGDHVATRANKNMCAAITCTASLVAILAGILLKSADVIQRANTFRV